MESQQQNLNISQSTNNKVTKRPPRLRTFQYQSSSIGGWGTPSSISPTTTMSSPGIVGGWGTSSALSPGVLPSSPCPSTGATESPGVMQSSIFGSQDLSGKIMLMTVVVI